MKKNSRKGILAAGNWIIDQIKIIDQYPPQDALANIHSQTSNNGGSPYNLLKDLALMHLDIPLEAIGLVGDDDNGLLILEDCKKHGINIDQLGIIKEVATSYTDVMTVKSNGRRTFFHFRGANSLLKPSHFDFSKSTAKIFHLGYLLLLDQLDELNKNRRTGASYVLENAKTAGFLTSADLVSEESDRFKQVVTPSLPYLHYLFLNEYEAEKITGISIKKENKIQLDAIEKAATMLIDLGVNKTVIIHFPQGALAVDHQKNTIVQASFHVDSTAIKGTVGAGDAFAAGTLYGIHQNLNMDECLKLGMMTAAFSLFDSSASLGVLRIDEMRTKSKEWEFRNI